LEERLESKFITDVVVDPWVVKPEILGNVTGKPITIHGAGFNFNALMTFDAAAIRGILATPVKGRYSLVLPVGVTITNVTFRLERFSADSITVHLSYVDAAQAVTDVFTSTLSAGSGVVDVSSGVIAHALAGFRAYYLGIEMNQDSRFYQVSITYNTPDCRITL
jgi:hypothetical protein